MYASHRAFIVGTALLVLLAEGLLHVPLPVFVQQTLSQKYAHPRYLPMSLIDLYPELQNAITAAKQRCVTVTTENGGGSGFFVRPGLALTNYHVLENGSSIWVNGHLSAAIAVSQKNDLALLRSDEATPVPVLSGHKRAQPLDIVFYVGSPLDDYPCAVFFGVVIGSDGHLVYTDTPGLAGMSGSALYATDGRLIGIQKSSSAQEGGDKYLDQISKAVTVQKISEFLREAGIIEAVLSE